MGGNRPDVSGLDLQIMEIGKIYNIKKNAWHTVSLSSDASVIIVENRDTDKHNSEYVYLSVEQQQWILKVVRQKEL
jgi:hypothetical protein